MDGMADDELSDEEALALLYEDAPGSTPVIPAEAFDPRPPITERQSRLLNILHAFVDGQQDWDVTKSELVAFPYEPVPQAEGGPTGDGAGAWWSDVESIALSDAPDDTWPQLMEACYAGMLTRDQAREVLDAISARDTAAAT